MNKAVNKKPPILTQNLLQKGTVTGNSGPVTEFFIFGEHGARYLDSKTSRWLSGDPAMGEYIPQAPVNDNVKRNNQNLPGQGGVFNYVNFHVYHYAGNNPVKYVDPDGKWLVYSVFNHDKGRTDYFMTTASGTSRFTRMVGNWFPGGNYLANMQNGLKNFYYRATATNFIIEYDSDSKGFDGSATAVDILSVTPAGKASALIKAAALAFSTKGTVDSLFFNNDKTIQNFLNGLTFNLLGDIENKNDAIAVSGAIAAGAVIYEKKNLEKHGISKTDWARAIKDHVLGRQNQLYDNVMLD